ncbi:hypothetical protein LBMAG53_36430 [Planctomycetota bacterium]|nr:hypothetical protein LBMAG53_36430 [Planctomycetota bacterium]
MMGGGEQGPYHPVNVSSFYIAKQSVSRAQFRAFLADGGKAPEWKEKDEEELNRAHDYEDEQPARVLPETARRFVEWMTMKEGRIYKLSSEAEVEFVARLRGEVRDDQENWWDIKQPGPGGMWGGDDDYAQMRPYEYFGSEEYYPALPNGIRLYPLGCWTRTKYYRYDGSEETNPEGPPEEHRIMVKEIRAAFRTGLDPRKGRKYPIRLTCPVTDADHVPVQEIVLPPAPTPIPVISLPEQQVTLAPSVSLTMRQCPAGVVTIGRPQEWSYHTKESPETKVKIPQPYWLGVTEVTQAQYEAIMGKNPSLIQGPTLPVHSINYIEMLAFCELLTRQERDAKRLPDGFIYRLPTEAEWEQAARTGTDERYLWGSDPNHGPWYAWYDVLGGPRPVATKWPNRWGFYDQAGNILEVVYEQFGLYPGGETEDPFLKKVITLTDWITARGGAWDMGVIAAQTTLRRGINGYARAYFMGFRLACGRSDFPIWAGSGHAFQKPAVALADKIQEERKQAPVP